MLLRVRDEAAYVSHERIVLVVGIHGNYIAKILLLNLPKAQERHMLAHVSSAAIADEWSLRGRRGRVILRIVLPIEQISDGAVLAIVVECSLSVAEDLRCVRAEITACDHRQVVWVRVVVEVAKLAEDCSLLSEAFQKVVLDG